MVIGLSFALLPTAQLLLRGSTGILIRARALLDQGSEVTFISEAMVQNLNLARLKVHVPIVGVGAKRNLMARHCVSLCLRSDAEELYESEFPALILPRPTMQLSSRSLPISDLSPFFKMKCADSRFHLPGKIDVILGVEVYAAVLRTGLKRFEPYNIIGQSTSLGWIFSGSVNDDSHPIPTKPASLPRAVAHTIVEDELSELLSRFWTLEEVPPPASSLSPDEEFCESLFKATTLRNSEGRYVVKIPIKGGFPSSMEESRSMGMMPFRSLMKRLDRDHGLAKQYRQFMKEYEDLGHMVPIPKEEIPSTRVWYLPHHAVIQRTVSGTKLRVVFDASRHTVGKHSLNDFLLPGPKLQGDLSLILMNWRQYRFVFTADIVKMFRQIIVDRQDQDLQRILWSPEPGQEPRDYRLKTVTYGTASAPYLAIRTLIQLAKDEEHRYPIGARCLIQQTYVDDIFAGVDNFQDAIAIRDQLVALLQTAGIKLDKWSANMPELIPKDDSAPVEQHKLIELDHFVTILGLLWHPLEDSFGFNVTESPMPEKDMTKRTILSNLARLFDPLGWLAPVVVKAKILLQDLWILKIGWETALSSEITQRWNDYRKDLVHVSSIKVSRRLSTSDSVSCELHGFSDASMRAYAATVYLRSCDSNGRWTSYLLMAKSKVAPARTVTIPRLELCGAVLLVKLIKHVRKLELFKTLPVICWSVSRDALAWISKHPSQWKVFIANRVCFQMDKALARHSPLRKLKPFIDHKGVIRVGGRLVHSG